MPLRYTTRPKTYWDADLEEEIASPVTMMIHEDDETCEDTGLLDKHGNPLYRVGERNAIGFKTGRK